MKIKNYPCCSEAGQTLLEILLAFGVSIMVLSAIITGITTSLSNVQYAKNQGLANSYAQEGMAVVRKTRDSSWSDFNLRNGSYCLLQDAVILPTNNDNSNCAQTGKIGDNFARSINLEQGSDLCKADLACVGSGCLKGNRATVKVSWSDSKCPIGNPYCHKVELITCFSNIDQKQTP
ncbi:MAG: hypothetical protein HW400_282 [Candidatus Levybacteria bacterium]|nr:hypothetical protein [Candidatus Levybacteria bacterium]